jgi:methionine-rich copper-binding protein CopC
VLHHRHDDWSPWLPTLAAVVTMAAPTLRRAMGASAKSARPAPASTWWPGRPRRPRNEIGNFRPRLIDYINMRTCSIRRGTAQAAAAAVAAFLVVAVAGAPAWAHARLLGSTPAANATVNKQVTVVTLKFNEVVRQRDTTIVVTATDGTSYSDGAARVIDTTVSQPVRALPPGVVKVTWRTVSADGDPVHGEFTFTLALPAPPSPSPTTAAPAPAATTPALASASVAAVDPLPAANSGPPDWIWLVAAALLILAGGAGALWWRRAHRTHLPDRGGGGRG